MEQWIIDAINYLAQTKKITQQQREIGINYYLDRYRKDPSSYKKIQEELTNIYNSKAQEINNKTNTQSPIIDDIEIIEEQQITEPSIEKPIQKTLKPAKIYKKTGFMNVVFFIFLTGIGSGITLMIILNLLLK